MADESGTLEVKFAQGSQRYFLLDRMLSGSDIVQLCCSGGWLTGRFEWDPGMGGEPRFYFSIERQGGGVVQQSIEIPDGALLRWPPR